eukprot:GHVS01060098.1.p1 GENE.GHVS01060098.1~~GHVS01060098.1.p1  ORF type:complete len:137 (-),score=10.10 GHVS01060098.1:34-444(-)
MSKLSSQEQGKPSPRPEASNELSLLYITNGSPPSSYSRVTIPLSADAIAELTESGGRILANQPERDLTSQSLSSAHAEPGLTGSDGNLSNDGSRCAFNFIFLGSFVKNCSLHIRSGQTYISSLTIVGRGTLLAVLR